jgi:Fe-S cluster biogenesis protein NfuA
MKISEMITILQETMKKTGDVEIQGACQECTTSDMAVSVLEDGEHYVCIEVTSKEEGE